MRETDLSVEVLIRFGRHRFASKEHDQYPFGRPEFLVDEESRHGLQDQSAIVHKFQQPAEAREQSVEQQHERHRSTESPVAKLE